MDGQTEGASSRATALLIRRLLVQSSAAAVCISLGKILTPCYSLMHPFESVSMCECSIKSTWAVNEACCTKHFECSGSVERQYMRTSHLPFTCPWMDRHCAKGCFDSSCFYCCSKPPWITSSSAVSLIWNNPTNSIVKHFTLNKAFYLWKNTNEIIWGVSLLLTVKSYRSSVPTRWLPGKITLTRKLA